MERGEKKVSIICKTCGNKIEDHHVQRCPRCYSMLKEPPKCENCKGCGLKMTSCNK